MSSGDQLYLKHFILHLEGQKNKVLRGECERSGLLHCPSCDKPVVELDNIVAEVALREGFVPLHIGCRLTPNPFVQRSHWRDEDRKNKRRIKAEAQLDQYRDWVESLVEDSTKSEIAHCPSCDLPFSWEMESGQAQFESGRVPGHPDCSVLPRETPNHPDTNRFPQKVRKAS
jgi:endogenous inhibitor of DNA gyrase (YacG/DUF329 family)